VDHQAMSIFMNYNWPGNIRELENTIYRAVVTSESDTIKPSSLPPEMSGQVSLTPENMSTPGETQINTHTDIIFPSSTILPMAAIEKSAMQHAMKITKGNLTLAAKNLGMGRATFYRKLEKYSLNDSSRRED
jgi:DNA-binding NtrC family response regulator